MAWYFVKNTHNFTFYSWAGETSQYSDLITGWTTMIRFPAGAIFVFINASRPAVGPIKPPIQWVSGDIYPGSNVSGVWRWPPPFSAEVKNAWNYTSTPPFVYIARNLI
jgi:hypothetical protein